MKNIRLLVCGGRDFTDREFLYNKLSYIHGYLGISCIIHGAARGADDLGGQWARDNGVEEIPFPADWKKYKKAAGPIRNKQMLDEGHPDAVVAFFGGPGTMNMIKQSKDRNIPVMHYNKVR